VALRLRLSTDLLLAVNDRDSRGKSSGAANCRRTPTKVRKFCALRVAPAACFDATTSHPREPDDVGDLELTKLPHAARINALLAIVEKRLQQFRGGSAGIAILHNKSDYVSLDRDSCLSLER
jgi:hypothetical protein